MSEAVQLVALFFMLMSVSGASGWRFVLAVTGVTLANLAGRMAAYWNVRHDNTDWLVPGAPKGGKK